MPSASTPMPCGPLHDRRVVRDARQAGAVEFEDGQAVAEPAHAAVLAEAGARLADVDQLAVAARRGDEEAVGTVHAAAPLAPVGAVAVEHLHPVALAAGDVDIARPVGLHAVHEVELSRPLTGLAPGEQVVAGGRVLVHARVAVAVGHVHVVGAGIEGDLGGTVERLAAVVAGAAVGRPPYLQHLTFGRALADAVAERVHQVKVSVRAHGEPVRHREQVGAPTGDEGAGAVEHHHGVLPAGEYVHPVMRVVDQHVGGVLDDPAVGQLCPGGLHLVGELPGSDSVCHGLSLC